MAGGPLAGQPLRGGARPRAEDLEAVIKEYPHYWLIEKHGEAGELAEKLS